ncbi:MAG TPA: type I-E CRISPR-associated protein Cse2/CasB [Proteus sp.]|uniref:CRISPR-associated Cse2 family protein n=1 Tax=Proteus hauseri ATCC 700826 TaxID=1354271 RepID=A0AAJ3HRD7_PROHU|nr:type I-E CRISPR-associated protein Cse2/CasB [Proteus hauseri]OAT45917.1 CRISPR-associated Cse2 family protein [Proteus hauseri ATCC 700826]QAV21934.1 type I-E CRISPR-associated protein Cse2/CasB [Proteus hauseri]HCH50381.1 type I-E CRISPR-associated protein Cse2/CasB [Proteus sp. (in: enterobacteria)]
MGFYKSDNITLYSHPELQTIVLRWWESLFLSPDELRKKGIAPAPSRYKAELKRCESITAIMLTEGFRSLWLSFPPDLINQAKTEDIERWATIVAVLVYITQNSDKHFATVAGEKDDSKKSIISESRFLQLQSSRTHDEFIRRLRRILIQIKGKTDVLLMSKDIEKWVLEKQKIRSVQTNKQIIVEWAMKYYQAAI